ncbi:MAG: DUF58 domain-containing protein [Rickettsiales bacterium]|nr:DUF58 domain-containing protein [Rickettsiales bacterium]
MIPKSLIKKIKALEISTRQIVNTSISGSYHSAFKGQGLNFADLREYQVGDDIRNIHWSVSAKVGTPYVKLYEEERELTVFIMVDLSGSGEFGSNEKIKTEIAAEIAAILGFSAIKNNDKVGLLLFTDKVELFIPAKKGKKHILRLLRDISYFKPENRKTDIGKALRYLLNMAPKKAIVFVISDFQDETFEENLKITAKKHDIVPVIIEDPVELKLPKSGIVALEDQETGEVIYINSSSKNMQEAYKNIKYSEKIKFERQLKKMNMDWIRLNTTADYLKPLTHFFKQRLKRFR